MMKDETNTNRSDFAEKFRALSEHATEHAEAHPNSPKHQHMLGRANALNFAANLLKDADASFEDVVQRLRERADRLDNALHPSTSDPMIRFVVGSRNALWHAADVIGKWVEVNDFLETEVRFMA